jgi:hypothetical protein
MAWTNTAEQYQQFIETKDYLDNERIRGDGQPFFEVLMTEEGDMSKTEEGQRLIELLKGLKRG